MDFIIKSCGNKTNNRKLDFALSGPLDAMARNQHTIWTSDFRRERCIFILLLIIYLFMIINFKSFNNQKNYNIFNIIIVLSFHS